MRVSDELKFSVRGFSAKRVSYVLSLIGFVGVPIHAQVSCTASGAIAGTSTYLLVTVGLLTLSIPRNAPNRYRPLGLAFLAVIANLFSMH